MYKRHDQPKCEDLVVANTYVQDHSKQPLRRIAESQGESQSSRTDRLILFLSRGLIICYFCVPKSVPLCYRLKFSPMGGLCALSWVAQRSDYALGGPSLCTAAPSPHNTFFSEGWGWLMLYTARIIMKTVNQESCRSRFRDAVQLTMGSTKMDFRSTCCLKNSFSIILELGIEFVFVIPTRRRRRRRRREIKTRGEQLFECSSAGRRKQTDVLYFYFLPSAVADVFEKNEKKSKTTSVYRLANNTCMPVILFTVVKNTPPSYSMYVHVMPSATANLFKSTDTKMQIGVGPF